MGRYLLDTNAFLWLMLGGPRLGPQSRALIEAAAEVHFSAASIWELELKRLAGQLARAEPFAPVAGTGLVELPVTAQHARALASVDVPHKDPFDRLLLAQAVIEGLTLITSDRALLALGRPDVIDARS